MVSSTQALKAVKYEVDLPDDDILNAMYRYFNFNVGPVFNLDGDIFMLSRFQILKRFIGLQKKTQEFKGNFFCLPCSTLLN